MKSSDVSLTLSFEDDSVSAARKNLRAKLNKLVRVTSEMAKKVGAGHHLVVKAKKELKRLRQMEEQLRWTAVVCWHKNNIERAELQAQKGGPLEPLEKAVQEAYDSELGHGHSLVLAGKRALSVLAKARHTVREHRIVKVQSEKLKHAAETGEVAVLDRAIEEASKVVGRGHPCVQRAMEHRKHLVFEEKHHAWQELVLSFKEAIAKANAKGDAEALAHWIREATQNGLGGGHEVVKQGKKWLEIIKKRQRLAAMKKKEDEAEAMLTSVLSEARGALDKLEVEVAAETNLKNVYIGRGGHHMHLNED